MGIEGGVMCCYLFRSRIVTKLVMIGLYHRGVVWLLNKISARSTTSSVVKACCERIGFLLYALLLTVLHLIIGCELVNITCLCCYRPDVEPNGVLLPWRRPLRQKQEM